MKIVSKIFKYTHENSRTANFSNIFLKFKNYQLIRGVYRKPTSNLLAFHARSDPPYGTNEAIIKARFLWFVRCCKGTQELISITNNFISKLCTADLEDSQGSKQHIGKKMAIHIESINKDSKISWYTDQERRRRTIKKSEIGMV